MATPIMTCGDSKPDAEKVHAGMGPEYEGFTVPLKSIHPPNPFPLDKSVLYAGFSLPETLSEVPSILAGRYPAPETLHTQIASNTFSAQRKPVAVVVGGGYDEAAYERLREASIQACGGDASALGVVFFRADNELTEQLVKEGKGPAKRTPDYGRAITARLKGKLAEMKVAEGVKAEDVGTLVWY